ncbi:hypothetical protein [Sinomonas humi]|uniref:Uncharacterized protein n=1 Tax=Sinomonas humi TaxID=1338436 RepID=A0A0B2APQ8_9MICC|nr:hypothetical protein [Sinomonas humi]KHL03838.1 hypothetical protein LK10_08000 [Sinomonas humi]
MAAVVFALATVPVVVMLVCGLVLVVSSVWRLRSRRAGGTGAIPMAFLWTTLGALVLSAGAVAVRGVLPEGTAPTAAPEPTVQLGPNPAGFSSSLAGGETPSGAVSAPASIVRSVSPSSGPTLSQAGLMPQPPAPLPAPGTPAAGAPYGALAGGAAGAPGPAAAGAPGAAAGAPDAAASGGGSPAAAAPGTTGTPTSPRAASAASSPAPAPSPSSSASPEPTTSDSAASSSKSCGTSLLGVTVSLGKCK